MDSIRKYAGFARNYEETRNRFMPQRMESEPAFQPLHTARIAFVDRVDRVVEQYMIKKPPRAKAERASSVNKEYISSFSDSHKIEHFTSFFQPALPKVEKSPIRFTLHKVDSFSKMASSKEYQKCENSFTAEYCRVNEVNTLNIAEYILQKMKQLSQELKLKAKNNIKDISFFLPSFIRDIDSLYRHITQSFENLRSLFNERKNISKGYAVISYKNTLFEEEQKSYENELAQIRQELARCKEISHKAQSELVGTKNNIKLLSIERSQLQQSVSETHISLQQYRDKLEATQSQNKVFEKELHQANDQIKHLNSKVSSLQVENQSIIQDNKQLVAIITRENKNKDELLSELGKLQKIVDTMTFEKKFLIEESSVLKNELEEAKQQARKAKSNIQKSRQDLEIEIQNLKNISFELSSNYHASQENLHDLQKDFDMYKLEQTDKVHQLKYENGRCSEIITHQREEIKALKQQVRSLEEKIIELSVELQEPARVKSDEIKSDIIQLEEQKEGPVGIDKKIKNCPLNSSISQDNLLDSWQIIKTKDLHKALFSHDEEAIGEASLSKSGILNHSFDQSSMEKGQPPSALRLPIHKLIEDGLQNLFKLHYERRGTQSLIFSDNSTLRIEHGVLREACAQLAIKIKTVLKSSSKTRDNIENFLQLNEEKVKQIIQNLNIKRKEKSKSQCQDFFDGMNFSELGSEGPIKKPQTLKIMKTTPHEISKNYQKITLFS